MICVTSPSPSSSSSKTRRRLPRSFTTADHRPPPPPPPSSSSPPPPAAASAAALLCSALCRLIVRVLRPPRLPGPPRAPSPVLPPPAPPPRPLSPPRIPPLLPRSPPTSSLPRPPVICGLLGTPRKCSEEVPMTAATKDLNGHRPSHATRALLLRTGPCPQTKHLATRRQR